MNPELLKQIILPILVRYKVRHAAIFGSFARGEETPASDLDLLVETDPSTSLFGFAALKLDLEDAVKRKIDLVEYHTIKPRLRESILKDTLSIL